MFRGTALCLLMLSANSLPTEPVLSPVDRLQARFSEPWSDSTYMIATVDTPRGLWNVYVVSIPPNQVAIRQSRQDGEYEFGMKGDLIWHIAYGKAAPTRLGPEWAWFVRNHELFRFSEWIDTLKFEDAARDSSAEDLGCRPVQARDRFDLGVTLCIAESGDVDWIERQTPAAYGDGVLRIEIDQWDEYLGRRMIKRYRQLQGGQQYTWEVQGLLEVPAGEEVEPPPGIGPD